MTSMPASRSARAMIFAPRSWPSRPGLATTTRIFRLEPAADISGGSLLHDELHPLVPEPVDRAVDDVGAALRELLGVAAGGVDAGGEPGGSRLDRDRVRGAGAEAPLDPGALGDGDLRHAAGADVVVVAHLHRLRGGHGDRGEHSEAAHREGHDDQLAHFQLLEDRRFRVRPEHLLKALDDLTLRGVYASAFEKVRHQVAIA